MIVNAKFKEGRKLIVGKRILIYMYLQEDGSPTIAIDAPAHELVSADNFDLLCPLCASENVTLSVSDDGYRLCCLCGTEFKPYAVVQKENDKTDRINKINRVGGKKT